MLKNSLRRLHIGEQNVLAGAPLSPAGAFIDILGFREPGALRQGVPAVRWPQRAHGLQRGSFVLDQGSYRLISLKIKHLVNIRKISCVSESTATL